MPKDKGGGVNKYNKDDSSQASRGHQNLKDLGITKDQSSQCQKIANMPETV